MKSRRLVDQMDHTLGRHCSDDMRQDGSAAWMSRREGLPDIIYAKLSISPRYNE